jgi:acyl-CoA synthetase (AMP-forming)/AMP-acid ligase II
MDGERLMGSAARDELQSALAAFPGVAVTEHDSRLADQNLVAYVAPDGPGLDMAELRAHARKILPASRTPVAIVLVDEIPVTAAGAVDIAALPAPELDGLLP